MRAPNGKDRRSILRSFDLTMRAPKFRWALPGDVNLCNDFTIGPDKALYAIDTWEAASSASGVEQTPGHACQVEGDDVPGGVRFCVDLRGEPALRAPKRLVFLPLLLRQPTHERARWLNRTSE
jgi:hypothetical protein